MIKYAPLEGPDVDRDFSEIELAKDILHGILPSPKSNGIIGKDS
jgi:hypothetical protein